jgi:hypothetical protein
MVLTLVVAAALARQALEQTRTVIFEGAVVESQTQPGETRVVVVVESGHEVARGEAPCSSGHCLFEIVVSDDSDVGEVAPDGFAHVVMNNLEIGKPQVVAGTSASGKRVSYAVMALKETADDLPPAMRDGQLGLFPDGGVAVIAPNRPPDLPRPGTEGAPAPTAQTPPPSEFPWLAVGLLAVACCGSVLLLVVLAIVAYFYLRRRNTAILNEPVTPNEPYQY